MKKQYTIPSDYGLVFTTQFFQDCLRKQLYDQELKVISADLSHSASEIMMLNLKHPKSDEFPIGVQKYNLVLEKNRKKEALTVIVKSKISEQHYLKAISGAFEKVGIISEVPLIDYLSQLEFSYVNRKEAAIYEMQQKNIAFQQYMPKAYGVYLPKDGNQCVLILQSLDDSSLSLDVFDVSKWDSPAVEAFITAIASIHAEWYQKDRILVEKISCFKHVVNAHKMQVFMPYWLALAAAVKNAKFPFLSKADYAYHDKLIRDIPIWRSKLDLMDKTLVHNDCVPKNLALSIINNQRQVHIYDWEIATIHVPQRDLVEFLSYVLPNDFELFLLNHYIEQHRCMLATQSKAVINETEWFEGFKYALYDYLIQRVFPQLVFEQLEARNIEKIYRNIQRMISLLS
jgi:thiamine kinase-like enzyme